MADLTAVELNGQDRVLTNTAWLTVSQALQQLFGTARGLVLPNLLGPLHYGTIATIALVERYSTFVNLGIHTATLYQVPAKHLAGQQDEAKAINDTVFSFSALTGLLASLALLSWTWASRHRFSPELAYGLLIGGMIPLLIILRGVFMTCLRATSAFDVISRGGILGSLALLILTVGLGWRWKTYGVMTGQLFALLLLLVYLFTRGRLRFSFSLEPRFVMSLLRFGIPIHFLLGLLAIYLNTADRLAIVRLFGTEQVGYYAIGQTLANLLVLIPSAASMAMSTDLIAQASQEREGARRHLLKATFAIVFLTAAFTASLIAAIPAIFRLVFPAYQPGIVVAQWLCVVAYFESLGMAAHYVVIARGRTGTYIIYYAFLAFVASWLLQWTGRAWGILGVGVCMVAIAAARNLWLTWMASRLMGSSSRLCWLTVSALLAIGAVGVSIGWTTHWVVVWPADATRWMIIGITLTRVSLVMSCFLILGILAARSLGISPTLVGAKLLKALHAMRLSWA